MNSCDSRRASAIAFSTVILFMMISCRQESDHPAWDDSVVGVATVRGKVTDTFGDALSDVQVSCRGTNLKKELRKSGTSAPDGSFEIADVPSNARYICFTREGYASVSYTLEADRFVFEDVIELYPAMEFAMAIITGTIIDAGTGLPMKGVSVSNGVKSCKTGEDGVFSLEGLTIKDYKLDFVTAEGAKYDREVASVDFVDGVASVPTLRLGGDDVWPGRKWQELADAPIWYGNEFRGSTGFGGRNDWSSGYMSAWSYYGQYRYEAEGCAFVTDITYGNQGDTEHFNGYVYGRKEIFEGNHIMTVVVRTHYANSDESALHFGVEVLDLSTQSTSAVKVGEHKHFGSEYASYSFDLSAFIGHEVVIAYGLYWYPGTDGHVPCRRVAFSNKPLDPEEVFSGTAITGAEKWEMFTRENILTLSLNSNTSFTGKNFGHNSGVNENGVRRVHNPGGQQGYSEFAGTNHIIMNWTYHYVRSASEPVNPEGYTIKCASNGSARYDNPDAYLANRFRIGTGNDRMSLYVRTFSKLYETIFRVTVVTDDGIAYALDPVLNTALKAYAVNDGNGCWAVKHEKGDGNLRDYAEFVYDLSQYRGQNVSVAISVHNGGTGGECKLCIYQIEMD